MPEMNGLEVARAIRPMLPSTSMMLFTLYKNELKDADAFAVGINAVISKTEGTAVLLNQAHMLLDT